MNINYEQIVIEELTSFLKNVKNKELDINLKSKIVDDLDLDSLDLVEISIVTTKKYGIKINEETMFADKINDVDELIQVLRKMNNDSEN